MRHVFFRHHRLHDDNWKNAIPGPIVRIAVRDEQEVLDQVF